MLTITPAWRAAFPGALVGVLAMSRVANPEHHPELERRKETLQAALRARYAGQDREALAAIPELRAYAAVFKRFKKTYHVALQLESVVLKGKPIPSVAALVEAMFMAELESLLLTAGHDLDSLQEPITLDASSGTERYVLMRGDEQQLKPNDMMIADAHGVISSVIYGPDRRTQITVATRRVLFTVYAPAGIQAQAVEEHLNKLRANVLCVAPAAEVITSEVCGL